jgi:hypothetical protein
MRFRMGFLLGFGTGYVLGTKAGRQRYEQIRAAWGQLAESPAVQRAAERTKEMAGEQARKSLSLVQSGVEKAGSAVRDRLHHDDDETDRLVDLVDDQSGQPPSEGPTEARKAFGPET